MIIATCEIIKEKTSTNKSDLYFRIALSLTSVYEKILPLIRMLPRKICSEL
jgi:hypothetical protein